ncbi:hypothetical protein M0R45_014962 [Rubus argutus]|uniref:Uncharacterized protein n=1 Tax=Rubus argutus TaxID=59490 RepID=A0AAW1XPA8_RUBAR
MVFFKAPHKLTGFSFSSALPAPSPDHTVAASCSRCHRRHPQHQTLPSHGRNFLSHYRASKHRRLPGRARHFHRPQIEPVLDSIDEPLHRSTVVSPSSLTAPLSSISSLPYCPVHEIVLCPASQSSPHSQAAAQTVPVRAAPTPPHAVLLISATTVITQARRRPLLLPAPFTVAASFEIPPL